MKPVVLITGTSSGIGLALASLLYKNQEYFTIAAARPPSLEILRSNGLIENNSFLIRPLDVTVPRSQEVLLEEINTRFGGVDILINNAGISFRSVIEEMDEREEELQMATNYFGPLALIRGVLPLMRAKRSGRIINISSVSGMMAMPTMGSYTASKFALEGASEALWYEMRPWNVKVTLIQPGFIRSKSYERVYRSARSRSSTVYANYYEQMSTFVAKLMNRAHATPDSVAQAILRTMQHPAPPLRVPVTLDAHIFSFVRRIMPRSLYHRLLYSQLPGVRKWIVKEEEESEPAKFNKTGL